MSSFFVPDGDGFIATDFTRGPWSPKFQHGGPSAALMARAIEHVAPDFHPARMTIEFLRPIPIERLTVKTGVVQQGRKVQWIDVSLQNHSTELARARAVCIRRTQFDIPSTNPADNPPPPEESRPIEFPFFTAEFGYHKGMELRFAQGGFGTGSTTAWFRTRHPLVAGEEPSPVQRVMVSADSGNGVSTILDWDKWTFVNPDLTVYLNRPPQGEWICLEAMTRTDPIGIGLSESRLYDIHGPIGYALQSLLIDKR